MTGRYSSSPESAFDFDIKNISTKNFGEYLDDVEKADLSDAFWNVSLVQHLDSSVSSSPYFNVFLAAQVKDNDKGFLSTDITVRDLVTQRGDIHHIFPKSYLKKNGLTKGRYNQIANYVYMQSEINVKIGDKAPCDYFEHIQKQCNGGKLKYGGINDAVSLKDNLEMHCIPEGISSMDIKGFDGFLEQRRQSMATKIKNYYFSL